MVSSDEAQLLVMVGSSKVIARAVASRIQQFSETFVDEEQQGFRRSRGADGVLQVSRRLAEEVCRSRGQDFIKLTLYDIEKAYPKINREALWLLLKKRRAPDAFACATPSMSTPNFMSS